jgi:hypothetical protein
MEKGGPEFRCLSPFSLSKPKEDKRDSSLFEGPCIQEDETHNRRA